MKTTDHLKLKKPDLTDYVNIGDLNDNMDILDTNIDGLDKKSKELEASISNQSDSIKKAIVLKRNLTLSQSRWALNSVTNLYEYKHTDSQITDRTVVDVNIKVTDLEKASDLLPANESGNGHVTLYAESKPDSNIVCDMKFVSGVI